MLNILNYKCFEGYDSWHLVTVILKLNSRGSKILCNSTRVFKNSSETRGFCLTVGSCKWFCQFLLLLFFFLKSPVKKQDLFLQNFFCVIKMATGHVIVFLFFMFLYVVCGSLINQILNFFFFFLAAFVQFELCSKIILRFAAYRYSSTHFSLDETERFSLFIQGSSQGTKHTHACQNIMEKVLSVIGFKK